MIIYICDDEENFRNDIVRRTRTFLPDASIYSFSSGEELLDAGTVPDIVLLDVDMGGMNGFETATAIKAMRVDPVVIFLTGYDRYMSESFDVHAFGYILKPVDDEKLRRVITEAVEYVENRNRSETKSLLIRSGTLQRRILLKDIMYVESFNKKVIIHLEDEHIETYARMEDIERELGSGFYRCHRCYIVNMAAISGYDPSSVVLSSGEAIPIAQKKFSLFVKNYLHYAKQESISTL